VLIVTAVPAERDAAASALGAAANSRAPQGRSDVQPDAEAPAPALPGGFTLRRVRFGGASPLTVDALAAGVGAGAAAAGAATALTAAALAGRPYGLVVSAGIGGAFAADGATAGPPLSGTAGCTADSRTASSRTHGPGSAENGTYGEGGAPHGPAPAGAPLGGAVVASAIVAADLGAQTPDGFASVTELGFGSGEHRPPERLVRAAAEATGAVTGPVLTVSTATGTAERAAELAARYPGAAAEAMEGFGVAEAAVAHGVPVLELRTVSNVVGPRDRAAWRIPEALAALGGACTALVPVLRTWAV